MSQVAYLGPEGTFSGILARQRFGKNADLIACAAIDGVFESVLTGSTPLGLVPVENSSGGTVHDTIDLLIRHAESIFILEEISLDIRIALLGRKGGNLRTVYSHFTQIKHHAEWLKTHHPDASLVPVASTATACERAAADPMAAALASPGAAQIYNLDILATPSDGREVNVTNFFIIAHERTAQPYPNRTALAATLQNQCGSLHKFLGPFARQKVTLTRIVSRPVPGQPQTYVFYIELEGAEDDPAVARALELAKRQARSISILGTFPLGRRFAS